MSLPVCAERRIDRHKWTRVEDDFCVEREWCSKRLSAAEDFKVGGEPGNGTTTFPAPRAETVMTDHVPLIKNCCGANALAIRGRVRSAQSKRPGALSATLRDWGQP